MECYDFIMKIKMENWKISKTNDKRKIVIDIVVKKWIKLRK